jgi:hypothetical protein
MGKLNQNKGSKTHQMTPKHRAGGESRGVLKPGAGSSAVRFEGTVVHADGGVGVTHPAKGNAGSHDHKARTHGGHGE